jgi:hypothetical protein
MTAAANASPNHVGSAERWTKKAREANPALDDNQAYRLGQLLKRQFYQAIGRKSAEARRVAREAQRIEAEAQAEFADAGRTV